MSYLTTSIKSTDNNSHGVQYYSDVNAAWVAFESNNQIFGVPLDSQYSCFKMDESLWTAATCSPETRRLVLNAIAYWLNETGTDRPFTDFYETIGTGSCPISVLYRKAGRWRTYLCAGFGEKRAIRGLGHRIWDAGEQNISS